MSAPDDTTRRGERDRPLAQPATERSGNEVGGMRAGADQGFADATQRSMEHADGSAMGRASTGDASGGARDPRLDLGGTNEPGAADTPSSHADRPRSDNRATPRRDSAPASGERGGVDRASDDDEDTWRHEPVAPVDEKNPLKSLGRAVADTITSGGESEADQPKR
jgi:hypothetical protein